MQWSGLSLSRSLSRSLLSLSAPETVAPEDLFAADWARYEAIADGTQCCVPQAECISLTTRFRFHSRYPSLGPSARSPPAHPRYTSSQEHPRGSRPHPGHTRVCPGWGLVALIKYRPDRCGINTLTSVTTPQVPQMMCVGAISPSAGKSSLTTPPEISQFGCMHS